MSVVNGKVSVKSSSTFTKLFAEFLVVLYTAFIVFIIVSGYPVSVSEMLVKIQMAVVSSLLTFSIWKVIQDTSLLDAGQFKEIYKPDYVVSAVCFIAVFISASVHKEDGDYQNVLAWSGSGLGIVIVAIIVALKGNAVATSKKGPVVGDVKDECTSDSSSCDSAH